MSAQKKRKILAVSQSWLPLSAWCLFVFFAIITGGRLLSATNLQNMAVSDRYSSGCRGRGICLW